MNLRQYLATPVGFGAMLDQLASPTPDPQLLNDAALTSSPAMRAFSASSWAVHRRGAMLGPGQDLVLWVAFQWRLHIDRALEGGFKPYVLRGALLFLARSVWPPYEVWVADSHALRTRRSVPSCIAWLRGESVLVRALRDLGVTNPGADALYEVARDLTGSPSAHYRWSNWAREEVHAMVIEGLGYPRAARLPGARPDCRGMSEEGCASPTPGAREWPARHHLAALRPFRPRLTWDEEGPII
jgi:hypothetical protein